MDLEIERKDFLLGAAAALLAGLLYVGFPSRSYVFEGLLWALPIDLEYLHKLCPGNYILYGPVGNLFHQLARLGGYSGLAVNSLQIMDGLFGAAGLFFFFLNLRQIGIVRTDAFLWSMILGVSLGHWRWSTEAQSYIFGAFLLELNLFFLILYAKGRGSPFLLGALGALAVTGHIVNAVFAPVAIWFLLARHGKEWKKPVLQYAATALLLSLAAYAAVLGLVVQPADSAAAWHWFLGSADTPDGSIWWHGGAGIHGRLPWLKMTVNIFTSFQPGFDSPPDWRFAGVFLWLARALLALFGYWLVRFRSGLEGLQKTVAAGCLVWLGAYGCVFSSWEPYTMVYRVADLIPLCVLLALGAKFAKGGKAIAALLLMSLAAGNFTSEIYPRSFASNNPFLARMEFIKAHTREGDWVAGSGGGDELYIPYFALRRPLIVGRATDNPAGIARRIHSEMDRGRDVYVTSRILSESSLRALFQGFRQQETARDSGGFALYRLTR